MHNVKKLGVDLNKVDMVVLSHDHGDHTGGLATVLGIKSDVSVYFPVSFPEGFASGAAKTVRVDDPVKLCEYGSLTGEMGTEIKEQSLILDTKEGIVVVTGCSHQGIVSIVEKAKALTGKPIHLVFGGFHLMRHSEKAVDEIISRFKELGVQNVGATHCTGDRAIAQFKEAFGDHYVPMGVGKRMTFSL